MRNAKITFVLSCAALLATVLMCCGPVYSAVKTVTPLGNGYGVTLIAETERAGQSAVYWNRLVSTGTISSAKAVDSSTWRVYGAQSDFEYKTGTGWNSGWNFNASDVVGFHFSFDPANPDVLDITSRLVATTNYQTGPSNQITDFGLGGVSRHGLISMRMDRFGSSKQGCAAGTLKADATSTTVMGATYADQGDWKLLAGGDSCNQNWTPPHIGQNQNLMTASSFANRIGGMRLNFTYSGPEPQYFSPHGQNLFGNSSTTNYNHRGTMTVNDAVKRTAILRSDQIPGTSPAVYACYKLRIGSYTDTGGTSVAWSDTNAAGYSFKDVIPDKDCYATNYYGNAGYRGPIQISMNDHGDVCLVVVVVDDGVLPDSTNKLMHPDLAVLFAPAGNYNNYRVVATNFDASDPDSVMLHNDGGMLMPCMCAAIDNSCNVLIQASNWMGFWEGSKVSSNAIFKAVPDSPTSPTDWSLTPVIWRGCLWKDGDDVYELAYVPTGESTTEWVAAPAIFDENNLNRTVLPDKTDPRYSFGGLMLSVGLAREPAPDPDSLIQCAIYVTATESIAAGSNVYRAKLLEDGEPVNLANCVITADAGTYVYTNPDTGSQRTYYRYVASDLSVPARLVISGIRDDLLPGDKICVSGYVATNDQADQHLALGEQYLVSTGLVLVARDSAHRPPYAMNSRSIGSGYGLNTKGMWVKAFGKVTAIDTGDGYIDVEDGGSETVRVYYGGNAIPTGLTAGDYVSATGDIISDSPKQLRMRGTGNTQDAITKH